MSTSINILKVFVILALFCTNRSFGQNLSGYMGSLNLVHIGTDVRLFPFPPNPGMDLGIERVVGKKSTFSLDYSTNGFPVTTYDYDFYNGTRLSDDSRLSERRIVLKYNKYRDFAPLGLSYSYGIGRSTITGADDGAVEFLTYEEGELVDERKVKKSVTGTLIQVGINQHWVLNGGDFFAKVGGSYSLVFFPKTANSNSGSPEENSVIDAEVSKLNQEFLYGFRFQVALGYLF
jgi:hypothetical protein